MTESATVTVLFTDLVNSTKLLTELGERAQDVRRKYFAALRRAAAAHEGTEVKSLGEGLMICFSSTVAAVSCAVAIQQAIHRLNSRDPDVSLAVRVGVSVGEATREGEDWFGTPVVEASRLCAAARGGQILVSEMVRALVGRRGGHNFAAVGPMGLKGLPHSMSTSEVRWVAKPTEPVPLPTRLVPDPASTFVGRESVRDHLEAAWQRAVAGARRAVLVAGEPGIGKTRLVAELAWSAYADGATVLYGRCDEELGIAYQPFAEALGHYVATCRPERLLTHVESRGGDLSRLVPTLTRRLPEVPPPSLIEPEADRLRLFDAVDALLADASAESPVLLVLDDLHWAAKPTLLLLRHLVSTTEPGALLIAGTYRDTELSRSHPLAQLLGELRRRPEVEHVRLSGLDQAGVTAYIRAAAGHELEEKAVALAGLVHAETDGNPFFVGEVLRHLVETGAVYQRQGVWASDLTIEEFGIPESVRDVVVGRLARLSEPAHKALVVAAVAGLEFELRVLERVPDSGRPDQVLDGLDDGVRAGLVSEVAGTAGHYTFSHALVRQILYGELTAARRARLHRRVGEGIEAVHGDEDASLPALAHHFAEAAPDGETSKAVEYALRAAERALDQVALEEAAFHLERGLRALEIDGGGDQAHRCELLLALARTRAHSLDHPGMREASLGAAAAARAAGSPAGLARAAYWYNGRAIVGTLDPVGVALCEEALSALGDSEPGLRALVLASLAFVRSFAGEGIATEPLSREALELARRADDSEALALALFARYYTLWGSPHAAEQLSLAEQLLESDAVTPSGSCASVDGYRLRAVPRLILGDLAGFKADLAEVHRLGHERRSRYFLGLATQWRTLLAFLEGRFDEIEELSAQALNFAPDDKNFLNSFAAQTFHLRFEQGRLADVEPWMAVVVEQNPGLPAFRAALAVTHVELGELAEARREFELLATDGFAGVSRNILWPTALALLAEVCTALGDVARAVHLYDLFAPHAGQLVVVGGGSYCPGAVDRYLGMLATTTGRLGQAEEHFGAALRLEGQLGSPPLLARTRLWYARMLLARGTGGDGARAAELLESARATADQLGMGGLMAAAAAVEQAAKATTGPGPL
ncbi:MAG: AAA family ATPase [Actinomycetota bacterium]|nr:AAA family ATPase [Actinomycetota bacterium]